MHDLEARAVRDACAAVELPYAFVLVGRGGGNIIDAGTGPAPLVIDAEGVVLRGGAVFAWCRAGCCDHVPQRWSSVDAAADFHGSLVVDRDGTRTPDDTAGERSNGRRLMDHDLYKRRR